MEVDSCPKEQVPKEPCCSQKNAQNDSKNHAAKAPILHFHSESRVFRLTKSEERNAARSLTTMRRRNIAAKDEDLTSLCMQMEDMNADKGFKPCETERKKRVLQRLRALVDSYKNELQDKRKGLGNIWKEFRD
ncbi:hypothetical protein JTE90_012463 [Oedothorax gibbosus]|uniref:Uncharacterized protein n=1 Tax=Oedothorax gibbosus TaxID=931172 RepID=A0AAV6UE05_9ARAC|nr:hypothetical protein JTE90_012463 [Oedothorax gibbosus]